MILSTDTQITDQVLLEVTQQENIDCVCRYVNELIINPEYNFRLFEWTARVENGKIIRADKVLLSYHDFFPNNQLYSYAPYVATRPKYYYERIDVMKSCGKLRDDQFIEFEVYDKLSEKSSRSSNWKNYLTE